MKKRIILAASMCAAISCSEAVATGIGETKGSHDQFVASQGPMEAKQGVNAVVDELVIANRVLYKQGIFDGFGNVSVRNPDNPDHFFMAVAVAPGLITANDIIEYDMDANPVDPSDTRLPFLERFIHSEIYKVRSDVNAIVHSHAPGVIPFSVTSAALRPIVHPASFLPIEGVPVFDTASVAGNDSLLVKDPKLGKALAGCLGQNNAALMRGHGDVVVGPNLRLTVFRAIYIDVNARLQLQALMLGGPVTYLSKPEAVFAENAITKQHPNSMHVYDRSWEIWKTEAVGTKSARN